MAALDDELYPSINLYSNSFLQNFFSDDQVPVYMAVELQ